MSCSESSVINAFFPVQIQAQDPFIPEMNDNFLTGDILSINLVEI
jgi:hypothetical protein